MHQLKFDLKVSPDAGEDGVHLLTSGMSNYDYPELQWFWKPAGTWREGRDLVIELVVYLVKRRPIIRAGDYVLVAGKELFLQLTNPHVSPYKGAVESNLLNIEPATLTRKEISAFHRLNLENSDRGSNTVKVHTDKI